MFKKRDPENSSKREISLLDEYKLCDERTSRLEGYIWQTAALFGIGSVVSLIAIANQLATSPNSSGLPTIFVSTFGVLLSLVWWRFARRWWSIQHLMFERMREIDNEVGSRMAIIVEERDDEALSHKRYLQMHGRWYSRLYNRYFYVPDNVESQHSDRVKDFEYRGMRESARLLVSTTILSWSGLFLYAILFTEIEPLILFVPALFAAMTIFLWRRR